MNILQKTRVFKNYDSSLYGEFVYVIPPPEADRESFLGKILASGESPR
jgi:hypothetical protein